MNRDTRKHRLGSVLLFYLLLSGCQGKNLQVLEIKGPTMGTFFQVKIITDRQPDLVTLKTNIEAQLETVNRLMSNWKEDSDISRFNRLPSGESLEVDPHTAKVVARALEIAQNTNGAFDPTLSPLIELWGFGVKDKAIEFPGEFEIAEASDRVGYQYISLVGNNLSKTKEGVSLNLSSLAKGYAVDLVYDWLVAEHYENFLINVGGDGRVLGANAAGKPWRMAIEAPDSEQLQGIYKVTEISDVAMATSGDYRIFFEHEGIRYSHLIDPRTGRPIPALVTSVSIIAPDCMTADAYATALSILSPGEGFQLVESMPGIECLMILRNGEGRLRSGTSSGMGAYLALPKE